MTIRTDPWGTEEAPANVSPSAGHLVNGDPRALAVCRDHERSWPQASALSNNSVEHETVAPPVFVDVAALLDGGIPDPPAPVLLRRDDGRALFYAGQVNVLFGDPESGKTWLAYAACVEALAEKRTVLIIDADHNGAQQVMSRLLTLGADPEVLRDQQRFRLAEPEDAPHLQAVVAESCRWRPAAAVVDSIGEILPILGLSSNSPDDYTTAHRKVLRPLAIAGSSVVAIDHLAKGAESRLAGPTGTAAKGRAVGGVSLRVTLQEPFAPHRGGSAWLSIRKDRPGGLRACSPIVGKGEQPAGIFTLESHGADLRWHISTPTDTDALTPSGLGRSEYEPTDEDLMRVDELPEDQRTHRGVRGALRISNDKASAILRRHREMDR